MARILISILSDNPIANFLFYKEKQDYFDYQIFITTPEMKKKEVGRKMETAMDLPLDSIKRIEVPNDNFSDIINILDSENFSKDDEYWINQTGGTKAMSIAVFQFFQEYNAKFVYLAIGVAKFVSLLDNESLPVTYSATLKEYLALYGIRHDPSPPNTYGEQKLYDLFNKVKKNKWYLPHHLAKADTFYTNPKDRVFYKGGWFEEYAYMRIKKDFCLSDDHIALSAKLYRGNSLVNDNEIDVMFIKDNVLNIIECKVAMNGYGDPKDTVLEYLYKLAAIAKDLGLRVNSYVFTLHKMSLFSNGEIAGFSKRVKILGLKGIWDGVELSKSPLNLDQSMALVREDDVPNPSSLPPSVTNSHPQVAIDQYKQEKIEDAPVSTIEKPLDLIKDYPHIKPVSLKVIGKIDLDAINAKDKKKR